MTDRSDLAAWVDLIKPVFDGRVAAGKQERALELAAPNFKCPPQPIAGTDASLSTHLEATLSYSSGVHIRLSGLTRDSICLSLWEMKQLAKWWSEIGGDEMSDVLEVA